MTVTVTVDLADLERIIFAASAVKQIEASLAAFKRDPFVQPHLEFTDAAKRLEGAMNHAKRAARAREDTLIDYNEPPNKVEMAALKRVFDEKLPFMFIKANEKAPDPKLNEVMSVFDRLEAKGLVRMGQVVTGIVWAGHNHPDLRKEAKFAVALTDRGMDIAREIA